MALVPVNILLAGVEELPYLMHSHAPVFGPHLHPLAIPEDALRPRALDWLRIWMPLFILLLFLLILMLVVPP